MTGKRAGIILAAVILVCIGGYLMYRGITKEESAAARGDDQDSADLVWQGKEYDYNDHLSSYLFIGVDTEEKAETASGNANAGQADALYLIVRDRVTDEITVITIPRDTMTPIETLGPGGKSLGMTKDHISISYAFGDGGHESCRLTKEAVSELLGGIRIQGYCSINLEGIPILTDCVGGVTVTVPNDSLEEVDSRYQQGARVTLTREDTELFVRYRNTEISQSAITRMERQQAYIQAFGECARAAFAEDSAVVSKLYEALEPYMTTNMETGEFIKILESLQSGGEVSSWTIPGEATEGTRYDEYHVEEDGLYEKIIETFCEEK